MSLSKPRETVDGRHIYDPEVMERDGLCPGGNYTFLGDVAVCVDALRVWAGENRWAAIDIETAGTDPFNSQVFLLSVSVKDGEAVVFDHRYLWQYDEYRYALRRFLTECKLIAHNALFEQSFCLAQFGVEANIRIDTMIMSQILHAGTGKSNKLGDLYQEYFGLELDKTWQKFFVTLHPASPIPNGAIAYSAGDVTQLYELAMILRANLFSNELLPIWMEIEKPFQSVVARARHRGVCVDRGKLEEIRGELQAELKQVSTRFRKLVGTKVTMDGDLGLHSCPNLNIASPIQLMELFRGYGCDLEDTSEKSLAVLAARGKGAAAAIAQCVLDFRGVSKILGTYVEPMLTTHINPKTGRIHANWKQTATDTGRMACSEPNLMNLPARGPGARIREAFVAQPGHRFVIADYSAQEVRTLGQLSQEPAIIGAFKNGEDFHARTARILFGDNFTKEDRHTAKTILFGLCYGAEANRVASEAKITRQAAQKLIEKFLQTYPKLAAYLKRSQQFAKDHLYSVTPSGRKRFYTRPEQGPDYERRMAAIGREGVNHPIQGCGADCIKRAGILIDERLREFHPECGLVLFCHDEVVATCPHTMTNQVSAIVSASMIEAAQRYISDLPVEVEVTVNTPWSK